MLSLSYCMLFLIPTNLHHIYYIENIISIQTQQYDDIFCCMYCTYCYHTYTTKGILFTLINFVLSSSFWLSISSLCTVFFLWYCSRLLYTLPSFVFNYELWIIVNQSQKRNNSIQDIVVVLFCSMLLLLSFLSFQRDFIT